VDPHLFALLGLGGYALVAAVVVGAALVTLGRRGEPR
jgi:hypothetical protein